MTRHYRRAQRRCGRSGNWTGLLLLIIGGGLLARQMGAGFPDWLFSWPMILIVIGLFIGISNRFRDFGWLIMMGLGVFFLVDDIWPDIPMRNYIWPVIIIGIGLSLIARPKRPKAIYNDDPGGSTYPKESDPVYGPASPGQEYNEKKNGEDAVDVVSVFGNVRKMVFSKQFRGGEVVTIFGGAELNLLQAEMNQPIKLEMVIIFGGAKLLIPADWQVQSDAGVIFGGLEDKRPADTVLNPNKVLILKGVVMFGGIEIKSY